MSALRVLVQQPVVPEYRRAFFTALDQLCRLTVVAGNHSVDAGLQQSIAPGPGWLDLRAPTVFPGGIHHLSLRAIDIPRYDVIIVNFNPRHTASIRLYRAARRHGCTLLWWNHLWSYTSTRRNLAIRRVLMNRCDGVVLYTDREARIGRAIGITPPVRGLNNCCHTDDALILRRAAIPEREREAHFLMLGRLTPKSRFDWVLQLAPAFEGRARFTMVGASPSQLQRFGNRPGDNIRLIAATYDEKEKVELLSAADYLVYPGPIGLGALEALSMGLPVITQGDRHSSPEHAYLRNDFNAAFTDGTREGLHRVIDEIVSGKRRFASRKEISAAVAHLNVESMAQRLHQFMLELNGRL